jgi:hypothetical protein
MWMEAARHPDCRARKRGARGVTIRKKRRETALKLHPWLSLSEIKSEHIDDAIHRELVSRKCVRRPQQRPILAHLCSKLDVSERNYNIPFSKGAHDAEVSRQTRQYD